MVSARSSSQTSGKTKGTILFDQYEDGVKLELDVEKVLEKKSVEASTMARESSKELLS